jgi:hypothetical protein
LERAERKLEHLSATNESLAKHHNRMLEQESAKRRELMNQLEDVRAQAVADGNSAAFKKADRQLDELRKESVQTPTAPLTTDIDPGIEEWLSENRWYSEDEAMQAMADGYSKKLQARNPGLKGKPFLEEIGKFVKENFKKEVKQTKVVDSESGKTPTRESKDSESGGRSYNDLPSDAKKECTRLIKQIKGFTKEQFVQYYDWE